MYACGSWLSGKTHECMVWEITDPKDAAVEQRPWVAQCVQGNPLSKLLLSDAVNSTPAFVLQMTSAELFKFGDPESVSDKDSVHSGSSKFGGDVCKVCWLWSFTHVYSLFCCCLRA